MNAHNPNEEFRSHVQRLVAEGKLTPEEGQSLLDDTPQGPQPEARRSVLLLAQPVAADPQRDLHLLVKGYSLTVVHDPAVPEPHLSANEDGRLSLSLTPHGWHVARLPDHQLVGFSSLKAILTVPFTPGSVRAEVEGGNLVLPDLGGDLNAEVNGGNLRMGGAHSLHAEVNGGNLTATQLSGSARVSVNGGNLSLQGATALHASVNGGNLRWAGQLVGGDHHVEVNAGNATLTLDPGSSVRLDAELTMGAFKADFPTHKSGGFLSTRHAGQLGSGEALLSCRVTAGGLKVVTA